MKCQTMKRDSQQSIVERLAQEIAKGRERMGDTEMKTEVPEGWQMVSVGNLLSILGGFAFKSADFAETGSPVIRISNLNSLRVSHCSIHQDDALNIASVVRENRTLLLLDATMRELTPSPLETWIGGIKNAHQWRVLRLDLGRPIPAPDFASALTE